MMQKPLVSILSPCYNSEAYVERMLKSILEQTYDRIELICIDDGSSDATAAIIERYTSKFEAEGKQLKYMFRNHKGQAAAINAGLKVINGDYFTLVDSDDFLDHRSIEIRAEALTNNNEYGIVVSDFYVINENNLNTIIAKGNDNFGDLCFQEDQLMLTIAGYSSVQPCGYMIRTEAMKKINPKMEINECIEGQNYQLLLPIYYHYKRMYINEALGYYVIRKDSHDHIHRTREQKHIRAKNLLKMLEEILNDMKISQREIEMYLNISVFNKMLEE